jgi:hypothetical protein
MAFTDVPALGTAAVTRHRSLGTHKSTFCKRGSVNVRFAPKATEVLRCREMTRCAKSGHNAVQQISADLSSPFKMFG